MNFQIGHIEIFFKKNMATLIHFELVSNIFYNHLHVIQGDDCKNACKTSIKNPPQATKHNGYQNNSKQNLDK